MTFETLKNDPAFQAWIQEEINKSVEEKCKGLQKEIAEMQRTLSSLSADLKKDKISILVSSHEMDKLLPAFIIANGAASFGMEVSMFFTLWGIIGLKEKSIYAGKTIPEKMLTMMLPDNPSESGISRMNMLGVGALMMRGMMKAENVASLDDLMKLAEDMGVELTACQMTMGIMGITKEELRPNVQYGGVASYIASAAEARITLFI